MYFQIGTTLGLVLKKISKKSRPLTGWLEVFIIKMRQRSRGTVTLIGSGMPEVKVGDIVNGKQKVKRIEKKNYIKFRLKYSIFHKKIKRYDKNTFEEIK